MPISSLLLEVNAGNEDVVAQAVAALPGVEVWAKGAGQLVVTTDTADQAEDRQLTLALHDCAGVISANVVFFDIEDCFEEAPPAPALEENPRP
jgi:nitrate reductase NapAB chaperone NapD